MSNMIAVTMGDPAGIGPEIIIKSLAEGALSGAPVVVVGCAQTLRRILALNITPRAELRIIDHPAEASFSPATINVIDEPLSDPQGLRPGEVQAQAGDLAFRCIRRATALALDGGGPRPSRPRRLIKRRCISPGTLSPAIPNCWPT